VTLPRTVGAPRQSHHHPTSCTLGPPRAHPHSGAIRTPRRRCLLPFLSPCKHSANAIGATLRARWRQAAPPPLICHRASTRVYASTLVLLKLTNLPKSHQAGQNRVFHRRHPLLHHRSVSTTDRRTPLCISSKGLGSLMHDPSMNSPVQVLANPRRWSSASTPLPPLPSAPTSRPSRVSTHGPNSAKWTPKGPSCFWWPPLGASPPMEPARPGCRIWRRLG
jgi:hypothetical protein